MANDELAIRFSSEPYATRAEVSRALGTSMIDNIWSNIISYRSQFTRVLSLKNIDSSSFNFVITPSISDHINNLERKMTKALNTLSRLSFNSSIKPQIDAKLLSQNLLAIAKRYNLDLSNSLLEDLIKGSLSTISPNKMVLVRYLKSLQVVQKSIQLPIDEDFLAQAYSFVSGNDELVSLYRTTEIVSLDQKSLINKTYNASPVNRIQDMMDNLLDFVSHSDISPLVKSIACFYFVIYIKPFDVYSEEMAVLLMKSVLAHFDYDDLATYLNFEQMLLGNQENLTKIYLEVQKTGDLTYLITHLIPLLDQEVTLILETINGLKQEETKKEIQPIESVAPANPTIEKESVPANNYLPEKINLISPTVKLETRTLEEANIAIKTLPIMLDEVDATKIEEHLMESNPALKRSEASFYARHCTIGKFYTITMFKTKAACAYETARTSMENLVTLGYYRKEKLKNKFIYTPVSNR